MHNVFTDLSGIATWKRDMMPLDRPATIRETRQRDNQTDQQDIKKTLLVEKEDQWTLSVKLRSFSFCSHLGCD